MVHTHTRNPLWKHPRSWPLNDEVLAVPALPALEVAPDGVALEVESQPELNDAPTVRGVENRAECSRPIRKVGIGIAESDPVENVEHVGSKLKRGPFRDVCILDNSKILVAVARTAGVWQETWRVSDAQWKGIDR